MASSIFITQHCSLGLNSCERNDSVDNIAGLRDCEIHKKLFRKLIASTETPPIKYNNGVKDLYWMLHSKIFTWSKKHTQTERTTHTPLGPFIRLPLLYLSFSSWNNCLSLSPSGQNTVSMSDRRERWSMTVSNDVLLPLTCKTEATFALQSL